MVAGGAGLMATLTETPNAIMIAGVLGGANLFVDVVMFGGSNSNKVFSVATQVGQEVIKQVVIVLLMMDFNILLQLV